MAFTYKYKGTQTVSLDGVGEVKAGDVVVSETEIDHPDFELTDKKEAKEAKKDSK